jgi:hypothetical protein
VTVDFNGTISSLSGRCPNVTFTIGGPTIAPDGSTDFRKLKCGDFRNGQFVSGSGVTQPDGTIKATLLQVTKP